MVGTVRHADKEWELRWIDTNKHLYSSDLHAEAVKRNIEKRYLIRALEEQVQDLVNFIGVGDGDSFGVLGCS